MVLFQSFRSSEEGLPNILSSGLGRRRFRNRDEQQLDVWPCWETRGYINQVLLMIPCKVLLSTASNWQSNWTEEVLHWPIFGMQLSSPTSKYVYCLLNAVFLRGGKHPASKVTSFITSALCFQAFGCRNPAQSSTGFSQLCTTELCISSFPRKDSSIMLTYITWAYSSAQLSSKIRRDSKTNTVWEFVFIFYVKDIFPPMSTSLWIKNTWCLTQKHKNYEGTLTSRLAAAAVNTYDKRSVFSGLPW